MKHLPGVKIGVVLFGAILLGVALFADDASAQTVGPPSYLQGGVHIGTGSGSPGQRPHRITKTLAKAVDYDFPFDAGCQDSWAATLTGAKVGDVTAIGIGPADGGNNMIAGTEGAFSCVVTAADTVKVRQCPALSDPVDAGFQCRIFSSQ